MTAPDLSAQERATVDRIEQAPDALGLREEVAALLAGHAWWPGSPSDPLPGCYCGWRCWPLGPKREQHNAHVADALLPIIERREAEAAERALRSAAVEWEALVQIEKPPTRGSVWLNRRADRIGGAR